MLSVFCEGGCYVNQHFKVTRTKGKETFKHSRTKHFRKTKLQTNILQEHKALTIFNEKIRKLDPTGTNIMTKLEFIPGMQDWFNILKSD